MKDEIIYEEGDWRVCRGIFTERRGPRGWSYAHRGDLRDNKSMDELIEAAKNVPPSVVDALRRATEAYE